MDLDLDFADKKIGPLKKEYTWKDAVLYALGIGAGFSEIDYCYEKNLKVIPSFAVFPLFDFLAHAVLNSRANLSGVLHTGQELIFHNRFPAQGLFSTTGEITGFYDQGKDKGAILEARCESLDSEGKKLFTSVSTIFCRLDGGFGGEKYISQDTDFPEKEPDFICSEIPSENQPLIYRLSGDIFPLHADEDFAKECGFEKPIMHGLCTFGYSFRSLIKTFIPGIPEKAKRIKCRFSGTLYPGVEIKTLIWKIEKGKALWRTINGKTGDPVIDNGIFEYEVFE